MKHLLLIIALCSSTFLIAQTKYEQGMRKAMELWDQDKLDEASNLFERIATVEKDNWLPSYHVAQIAIVKNWRDFENQNETTLKVNGDKAQEYINAMCTIEKDNPYADYLQAQLYTVWVAYDGMKYGMKYAGTIGELYQKMVKKDPDNPIFIADKAQWDMGSAKYFGSSIEPYCAELKRAIELFATFKPETEFHPKGNVKRALESAEACN
ncbi:hypothetical protein [Dokdonia sp. LLG6352-1]|uniref:hypothetical protein n=1 Tax=Dokdonia sp. LLG6352-1 TaxID=3160831 RepID=UPI00386B4FA3